MIISALYRSFESGCHPEILPSLTCLLKLYCLWYVQEKLSESLDHVTMKVLQADGLVNTFRMLRAPIIIPGIQVCVFFAPSVFLCLCLCFCLCLSVRSFSRTVCPFSRTHAHIPSHSLSSCPSLSSRSYLHASGRERGTDLHACLCVYVREQC